MLKFRYSNISLGLIIFLSPILLVGVYVLLSGVYFLNEIKNPLLVNASVESIATKKEVIGMPKNSMIHYQVGILKTKEYPCRFNLGEIKDSSYIISLLPEKKVHIYIKQRDKNDLTSNTDIEVVGLISSGNPIIPLGKTLLKKQQALDTRIKLGTLAIIISLIIFGISGFKRE